MSMLHEADLDQARGRALRMLGEVIRAAGYSQEQTAVVLALVMAGAAVVSESLHGEGGWEHALGVIVRSEDDSLPIQRENSNG